MKFYTIKLAAAFLGIAGATAFGDDSNWTGAINNDFYTAGNWDTNAAPSNAHRYIISSPGASVTTSANAQVLGMVVSATGAGPTLTITHNLNTPNNNYGNNQIWVGTNPDNTSGVGGYTGTITQTSGTFNGIQILNVGAGSNYQGGPTTADQGTFNFGSVTSSGAPVLGVSDTLFVGGRYNENGVLSLSGYGTFTTNNLIQSIYYGNSTFSVTGGNLSINVGSLRLDPNNAGFESTNLNATIDATGFSTINASSVYLGRAATFYLSLGNGFTPTTGTVYHIISNPNGFTGYYSGFFKNVADGDFIYAGNIRFQASYNGGGGHDFTLTVIGLLDARERPLPANAVVNVVTDPRYLVPLDGSDVTAKLQQAINENTGIIYLPDGTYNVSAPLVWKNSSSAWKCFTSLYGENTATTIIKLSNNNAAYQSKTAPAAVVVTASQNASSTGAGEQGFNNMIANLTIDTGSGNPGAIGLDFNANNVGLVENVTILSSDPNYAGVSGLSLCRDVGPAFFKNLSITGFDTGIDISDLVYNTGVISVLPMESIFLHNQGLRGIRNANAVTPIRGMLTGAMGTAAVIENNTDSVGNRDGVVAVIGGQLEGGASTVSAITNYSGLYVRGTYMSGYGSLINDRGTVINTWQEYAADSVSLFSTTYSQSLDLPIVNTPLPPYDLNMGNWRSVGPPSGTDDTAAIQAAMDSGASTVYFQHSATQYRVSNTIHVRGNVSRIFGSNVTCTIAATNSFKITGTVTPVFQFDNTLSHPVVLENLWLNFTWDNLSSAYLPATAVAIQNNSSQDVIIRNFCSWGNGIEAYRNGASPGRLFLEDVCSTGNANRFTFTGQNVWARQLDPEVDTGSCVINDGGQLWILGIKTERDGVGVETRNGGQSEVIGSTIMTSQSVDTFNGTLAWSASTPAFLTTDSSVSIIGMVMNQGATVAQETRNGTTLTIIWRDQRLPLRGGLGASLYMAFAGPITPSNTFADWLSIYPGASGFTTTSGYDGIANGLKHIFGTSPVSPSSAGLTLTSVTNNSLVFNHPLNPNIATDVTYAYEWSTDLNEWKTSGQTNAAGVTVSISAGAAVSGMLTGTCAITSGSSNKLFIRIAAQLDNP